MTLDRKDLKIQALRQRVQSEEDAFDELRISYTILEEETKELRVQVGNLSARVQELEAPDAEVVDAEVVDDSPDED